MASSIDATKPEAGTATTASVRANFSAAKSEIEALQTGKADLASPALTGTATAVNLSVSGTLTASGTWALTGSWFIDGTQVTVTAAELNVLDGITATTAELNILDGVTATAAELNILDGVTSTTAELNILDGVTASASDINKLSGVSGDVVGTTATQTLTNKTLENPTLTGAPVEDVYAISGTTPALDPGNGTIQTWTLTGNSAPTDSLANGESVLLMITNSSSYSMTWPTMTWVGGAEPTLESTGVNCVELWKVGGTLYGAFVGNAS